MKTSQSFIYDKSGNIEFITKEEFIKQFSSLYKEQLVDTLSYSTIIKKYEKNFTQIFKGIYKVNKLQDGKAIICLINKTIDDFEKVYKKEEKLTIPSKYDIIKNYQPKETKEKLKMKNKKMIKRIAVASLACFLAIPTINTVPTQAETLVTVEMLQQEIEQEKKKIEDAKKKIEICKGLKSEKEQYAKTDNTLSGWENAIENYEINIKDKQQSIDDIKNGVVMYRYDTKQEADNKTKEIKEKAVAEQAQKTVKQIEKDKIANTIYQIPAGVDNVYDFVPHFDDESKKTWGEEHKYERTDMPGIIFTLRCSYIPNSGKYAVTDVDPHFTISDFKSIKIKRYKDANSREIEYDYVKQFTYNYISPFDGFGGLTNGGFQASVGEDMRLATYTGGVAKINKGQNSFKVHSFWKQTDESGTVLFGGQDYTDRMNAFSAEAFEQAIKNHGINQSLTNNYRDALGESIENAKNWVKKWDDQGFNPIIEVTPYYGE